MADESTLDAIEFAPLAVRDGHVIAGPGAGVNDTAEETTTMAELRGPLREDESPDELRAMQGHGSHAVQDGFEPAPEAPAAE